MPNLVKIGPAVLEKIFKALSMHYHYFANYLPLEKGGALHLNKLESPFTQGCIVPSLVEIGPVVLEKVEM